MSVSQGFALPSVKTPHLGLKETRGSWESNADDHNEWTVEMVISSSFFPPCTSSPHPCIPV
jgi:hypothetical protein